MNGAVAHLGKVGDRLTIMAFSEIESHQAPLWRPRVIVLGEGNRVISEHGL
jgi:aspartate 1-decarboxylase